MVSLPLSFDVAFAVAGLVAIPILLALFYGHTPPS